jgi:hypothetical protein
MTLVQQVVELRKVGNINWHFRGDISSFPDMSGELRVAGYRTKTRLKSPSKLWIMVNSNRKRSSLVMLSICLSLASSMESGSGVVRGLENYVPAEIPLHEAEDAEIHHRVSLSTICEHRFGRGAPQGQQLNGVSFFSF